MSTPVVNHPAKGLRFNPDYVPPFQDGALQPHKGGFVRAAKDARPVKVPPVKAIEEVVQAADSAWVTAVPTKDGRILHPETNKPITQMPVKDFVQYAGVSNINLKKTPLPDAHTPAGAAIVNAVYAVHTAKQAGLPPTTVETVANLADKAVRNNDPSAFVALSAMTSGTYSAARAAGVDKKIPAPPTDTSAQEQVRNEVSSVYTEDLAPVLAQVVHGSVLPQQVSDAYASTRHYEAVQKQSLDTMHHAFSTALEQGDEPAAKALMHVMADESVNTIADAYSKLASDPSFSSMESTSAALHLTDAIISSNTEQAVAASNIRKQDTAPTPDYVTVEQATAKAPATIESYLPPKAMKDLSALGEHVVKAADSLLASSPSFYTPAKGQAVHRTLMKAVEADPLLHKTVESVSKRQASRDIKTPMVLADTSSAATLRRDINTHYEIASRAIDNSKMSQEGKTRTKALLDGLLQQVSNGAKSATGVGVQIKPALVKAVEDAGLSPTDRKQLQDTHIPNIVAVNSKEPADLKGVLYHEMMHTAMTPVARKNAYTFLKKAAKSTNPEIRQLFVNAVSASGKSGGLNPERAGVEEAISYMVTEAANTAERKGMTVDHYLNTKAGKGIKSFIQNVILPKVRAYGMRNNIPTFSKGLNLQTFVELARQAASNPATAPVDPSTLEVNQYQRTVTSPNNAEGMQTPSDAVRSSVVSAATRLYWGVKAFATKVNELFNFRHRIARSADKYLNGLPTKYFDFMRTTTAEIRHANNNLHDYIQQVGALSEEKVQQVNDLLVEMQRLISVAESEAEGEYLWPFKPDWLDGNSNRDIVVDPDLAARFEALAQDGDTTAQDILKGMLKESYLATMRHIGALEQFKSDAVQDLVAEGVVSEDEVPSINEEYAKRIAALRQRTYAPYAPLSREGDYIVVAESKKSAELHQRIASLRAELTTIRSKRRAVLRAGDTGLLGAFQTAAYDLQQQLNGLEKQAEELRASEQHYYFAMTDTLAEAKGLEQQLQGQYEVTRVVPKSAAGDDAVGGARAVELARMHAQAVLGVEDAGAVDAALSLYLIEAQQNKLWQHLKHRKFVAGFDDNLLASLAHSTVTRNNAAVSLRSTGTAADYLRQMQVVARAAAPEDAQKAQEYANEMLRGHKVLTKPVSGTERSIREASVGVMAFNAFTNLLTSPMFYAQTWLQNLMMTLPVLSEFGTAKASSALVQGHKDMLRARKLTKKRHGLDWVKGLFAGELLMDEAIADPTERKVIRALWDAGILDLGLSSDFGDLTSLGNNNPVMRKAKQFHYALSHAARVAEVHARGAAALAAFRLKLQNVKKSEMRNVQKRFAETEGLSPRELVAFNYALETLTKAHGDYSHLNTPRGVAGIPGGIGNLLAQYKKFMLIQTLYTYDLFKDAFKSAKTADEKAAAEIARKQLLTTIGISFAATGILGIPAATLMLHFTALLGGGDLPDDEAVKLKLREMLGSNADLVLHGLPSILGLSLTEAIGYGNVGVPVPYAQMEMSKDGFNEMLVALLGPTAGNASKIWSGMGRMGQGDLLGGVRDMAPTGVRSMLDLVRYHVEDGLRDRSGRAFIQAGSLDWMEQAFLAANMNPITKARNSEVYYGVKHVRQTLDKKDANLRKLIAESVRKGNDPSDYIGEWVEVQKTKAAWGFKPSNASSLRRSIQTRIRQDYMFINDVPFEQQSLTLFARMMSEPPA